MSCCRVCLHATFSTCRVAPSNSQPDDTRCPRLEPLPPVGLFFSSRLSPVFQHRFLRWLTRSCSSPPDWTKDLLPWTSLGSTFANCWTTYLYRKRSRQSGHSALGTMQTSFCETSRKATCSRPTLVHRSPLPVHCPLLQMERNGIHKVSRGKDTCQRMLLHQAHQLVAEDSFEGRRILAGLPAGQGSAEPQRLFRHKAYLRIAGGAS